VTDCVTSDSAVYKIPSLRWVLGRLILASIGDYPFLDYQYFPTAYTRG